VTRGEEGQEGESWEKQINSTRIASLLVKGIATNLEEHPTSEKKKKGGGKNPL